MCMGVSPNFLLMKYNSTSKRKDVLYGFQLFTIPHLVGLTGIGRFV